MKMRKELLIILCIVLAVWFFVMGFELGSYREKKAMIAAESTTVFDPAAWSVPQDTNIAAPSDAPTQPAATMPTAAAENTTGIAPITTYPSNETSIPSTAPGVPTSPAPTAAANEDVSTLSKAQILQKVSTAMQTLRAEQNMKAQKSEHTAINIVDCSVPSAVNLLNSIIGKLAGDEVGYYEFKGGVATGYDGEGKVIEGEENVTPIQVIPPRDVPFSVPEAGVTQATAVKNGSNTVYTLKIAEESTTLENPIPPYNSKAIGYLNLAGIDVPGATITQANMHYSGSTLTITTNADGKITELHLVLPMDGSGGAKMGFLSGTASFNGEKNETWQFIYS